MEIVIILLLIIFNGILAMAEIAIVSARKSRLRQQANEGSKNAQAALELAQSPGRFLSTVQIGITFVGIFAGAFGGETIAKNLSNTLSNIPFIASYAEGIAILLVVISITYLSLIIGELVPKRIALNSPEAIAKYMVYPMGFLSYITSPLVSLLTFSSDLILRLLQIKPAKELGVSEEEIRMLIGEGTRSGVFNIAERDIVERTLKLSDRKVNTLMTPRKEVIWLELDSPFKVLRSKIAKHPHAQFPVCRDNLDKVVGIVRAEDMLTHFLLEEKIEMQKYIHKPLFVPESMDGLKILELFKKSGIHMAIVVDEYGSIQGLLTITDILEAIVGDISTIDEFEEKEIVERDNKTFLVDGLVPIDEFKDYFHIKKLPDEKSGVFHTIGGFIMHKLGHIPVSGDKLEWSDFKFEVMDMDGNRIDKILITPKKTSTVASN